MTVLDNHQGRPAAQRPGQTSHSAYVATKLSQWLDQQIGNGLTDHDIERVLTSSDVLLHLGFVPSTTDLVAAYRARVPPASEAASPVRTAITFIDEAGTGIERVVHPNPAAAAADIADFLETCSDHLWKENGASAAGPANYWIHVQFERSASGAPAASSNLPGAIPDRPGNAFAPSTGGEAAGTILLTTELFSDGDEGPSEAGDSSKATWPARVERGAWGGLLLFVERPAGVESCLHVEKEDDQLKVKMWTDVEKGDDQALIVRLADTGFALN